MQKVNHILELVVFIFECFQGGLISLSSFHAVCLVSKF